MLRHAHDLGRARRHQSRSITVAGRDSWPPVEPPPLVGRKTPRATRSTGGPLRARPEVALRGLEGLHANLGTLLAWRPSRACVVRAARWNPHSRAWLASARGRAHCVSKKLLRGRETKLEGARPGCLSSHTRSRRSGLRARRWDCRGEGKGPLARSVRPHGQGTIAGDRELPPRRENSARAGACERPCADTCSLQTSSRLSGSTGRTVAELFPHTYASTRRRGARE